MTMRRILAALLMMLLALALPVFAMADEAEAPAEDVEIVETVDDAVEEENAFYGTFWALVPPIIAIGLALITKEVYSSLFVGILIGALLHTNFSFLGTMDTVVTVGIVGAVEGSAGIFLFLVLLGILVALINQAGGSYAFGTWASKHIKSRVGAQLATFALGVMIFVDDYFNCLTVGSVMRPITDRQKISRAKLAYLIDATAAPICMIAPLSSWACAVAVSVAGTPIEEAGIGGLSLFIQAIPFNFYSLLTIVFIIAIAFLKFDYGAMKRHELNALNTGDLFTEGDRVQDEPVVQTKRGSMFDLVFPVVVLIVCCIGAILYSGGLFSGAGFFEAFENCDSTVALPWGALLALVISLVYFCCRRVLTLKASMECVPKGFNAMVPALLILTLATALKSVTNCLGSDVFVSNLLADAGALHNFLPAIIFIVACVIAFSTGTSWGTFGILIPIVASVFEPGSQLLTIGISACLAGAVCGDHCSPISDTTIMASAGAGCNHVNHVSTQLPYAITMAAISFAMFIFAGFVQNAWIALPVGVVLTVLVLVVIKAVTNKKAA